VYKDSSDRENPWVALRAGVDDGDGNMRRPYVGRFKTEAEADQALARDRLMPAGENSNITLKDLFDIWKTTPAYLDLAKQTQDNYNAAFRYMAEFYGYRFKSLRAAHFQKTIDDAIAKGLSRSTLEKIKALYSILSHYGFEEDIVTKTYLKGVRLPKPEKKKIKTFTEFEIAQLFAHADEPLVNTILILIYTGMRIEELLSLTKFNVDLKEMLFTGGIKTEAGEDRIIPIHPKIQSFVRAWYDASENYLIEFDKEIGNKKKGTHKVVRARYSYSYYRELYDATLESLGIRKLTPHKARHTFFTRLSERCNDRKGMALVGGHTDPDFTEKAYVQPDIDRLRNVINCL